METVATYFFRYSQFCFNSRFIIFLIKMMKNLNNNKFNFLLLRIFFLALRLSRILLYYKISKRHKREQLLKLSISQCLETKHDARAHYLNNFESYYQLWICFIRSIKRMDWQISTKSGKFPNIWIKNEFILFSLCKFFFLNRWFIHIKKNSQYMILHYCQFVMEFPLITILLIKINIHTQRNLLYVWMLTKSGHYHRK